MKRLYLFLAVLLAFFNLFSQKVPISVIQRVAKNARLYYTSDPKQVSKKDIETIQSIGEDSLLYVINYNDNSFIIAAGDSTLNPILGYSENGPFSFSDIPPGLQFLLDKHKAIILSNRVNIIGPQKEIKDKWLKYAENPIGDPDPTPIMLGDTLIKAQWDQGDYSGLTYNRFCPIQDGNYCYAGCVAVAMAQILHYWNCRVEPTGSHSYQTNYGTLSANFGATNYFWSSMGLTTSDDYNSLIIYHCGISTDMVYRSSSPGSGSTEWHASTAFKNYFGFSHGTHVKERFLWPFGWNDYLIDEIIARRPVLYSGMETAWPFSAGHSWVVCGYSQESDKFYCNWGWGGENNGWFDLGNFYYTFYETAIVGAEPIKTVSIGTPNLVAQQVTFRTIITIPPVEGATNYEWTTLRAQFPALELLLRWLLQYPRWFV